MLEYTRSLGIEQGGACKYMVAYFWTAHTVWFQGGTGPNSENLPCPSVTCNLQKDSTRAFLSTGHLLETTLKVLGVKLQFSQQFFIGRLTEPMMPELCYKFG